MLINLIRFSLLTIKRELRNNLRLFIFIVSFTTFYSVSVILADNFDIKINEILKNQDISSGDINSVYKTIITLLDVINVISFLLLLITLFIFMVKKIMNDETNYIFMTCFGYKSTDILTMIFINFIMVTTISSMIGFVISIGLSQILKVILSDYFDVFKVCDFSILFILEIVMMIYSLFVSFLFIFRVRNKSITSLLGGRA